MPDRMAAGLHCLAWSLICNPCPTKWVCLHRHGYQSDSGATRTLSPSPPLDAAQLGARLDDFLNPAISNWLVTEGPARGLVALDRPRQEFILRWG